MKKFFFLALFILLIITFYFNTKTQQSDTSSQILNHGVDNVNDKDPLQQNENIDKNEKLMQLNGILENKIEKAVFAKTYELFTDQLSCLKDKTCLDQSDQRFYDEKIDPAFTVLRKSLEILNKVTLEDTSKLNEISDEKLIDVITLEHSPSSFMAYSLLMRKGVDQFLQTATIAPKLKGEAALNYLRQFKNSLLLTNEQAVSVRDAMIKHYLASEDNATSFEIIKEVKIHPLNTEVKQAILDLSCKKITEMKGESHQIFSKQLDEIARSLNQVKACQ